MTSSRVFDFIGCDDPPSFFQRAARKDARRQRREQGLPVVVTDVAVIERLASLLRRHP